MPVRFAVAPHPAVPVAEYKPLQKPRDCLDATWGQKSKVGCTELLQSSLQIPAHWPPAQIFDAQVSVSASADAIPGQYLTSLWEQPAASDVSQLCPKNNGFVDAVVEAYNNHHHLIIRPDDIWLAILSQFNLYVNANAETLRSFFVAHNGKKELIVQAIGTRYTVDFGSLAKQMTVKIDENLVDKGLKYWILPDFTTTTNNDAVMSAVMMMSTLKAYFNYTMSFFCGIPSVTLEGEKQDWEKLLARIDRLKTFGREPEAWSALLQPILTRFVRAFDGDPGADFWNHVCHYQPMGSGSNELGGWITAFCVWDQHGKWIRSSSVDDILAKLKEHPENGGDHTPPSIQSDKWRQTLKVDGIPYPRIEVDDIPPGFCEVDVKLDDHGEEFKCMMVAGHMAIRIEGPLKDAVRPHSAWFMFTKDGDHENK